MDKYYSNSTFIALFSLFIITIISFTLPLIGGIYIVSSLGGSHEIAIYSVCFYGFGNALGIPLGRVLIRKIGAIKLLFICTALFGILSLLCALAPTFPVYITIRLFQGFAVGPLFILFNQLITSLASPSQKSLFTFITLMIFTIGPSVGACWGGWIAYDYNWRIMFYINFVLLIFLAIFLAIRLRGFSPSIIFKPFDTTGYFFYAIAIFSLGFALTTGQEFDWHRSPLILSLLIIGTCFLIFFILRSIYCPHPLFEMRFFKLPQIWFGLVHLTGLFSIYFGTIILLAFWLHLYVNYTPIWIGLILGVMVIVGGGIGIILRKFMAKIDVRIPLLVSIFLFMISSFYTTTFNSYVDFDRIAFTRILAGGGLAFFLPSIFRHFFETISTQKTLELIALFQVSRVLSSSLGAALFSILFQRRQTFYHDRMGSRLTEFSGQTDAFFSRASDFFLTGKHADTQLQIELSRVATSLALDDCFYLMGCLLIALFILSSFSLLVSSLNLSNYRSPINVFPFRKTMD